MSKHEAVYVTVTIPDDKIEEFLKVRTATSSAARHDEAPMCHTADQCCAHPLAVNLAAAHLCHG